MGDSLNFKGTLTNAGHMNCVLVYFQSVQTHISKQTYSFNVAAWCRSMFLS